MRTALAFALALALALFGQAPFARAEATGRPADVSSAPSGNLARYHEGFILRAALGPGYFRANNYTRDDQRVITGFTSSFSLALGGVIENLVFMGGAYFRDQVWGLQARDELEDGDEVNLGSYSMALETLGLFLDFYFGPRSGTHLQLLTGIGTLQVTRPGSADIDDPTGAVVNLGFGHEWWVSDDRLVGLVLSVNYARMSVDEGNGDEAVTAVVPQLSATFTHD